MRREEKRNLVRSHQLNKRFVELKLERHGADLHYRYATGLPSLSSVLNTRQMSFLFDKVFVEYYIYQRILDKYFIGK